MKVFKKDDKVTIAMNGKVVDATVTLASPNGVSLMVTFDGAIGGVEGGIYVGMMPIMYDEERKVFTDLIAGRIVDINPVR